MGTEMSPDGIKALVRHSDQEVWDRDTVSFAR